MIKKMLGLVITVVVAANVAGAAPRQCNPEKSKPCGMSCIKKEYACHKPVTTSVVGTKQSK